VKLVAKVTFRPKENKRNFYVSNVKTKIAEKNIDRKCGNKYFSNFWSLSWNLKFNFIEI